MGERVVHPAVDEDTVLFVARVGADALGHERVVANALLAPIFGRSESDDLHERRAADAVCLPGLMQNVAILDVGPGAGSHDPIGQCLVPLPRKDQRVDVVLARGAEDFHRQRHLEAAKLKGESGDQLRVVTLPVILADHDDAVVVQLGEQVLRRRLAGLPQIILHPIGDERHRDGEDQSSEGAVHDFLPR